jgi:GT2 family glycosyltransferase
VASTLVVVPTLGTRSEWLRSSLSSVLAQGPEVHTVVVGPTASPALPVAEDHGLEYLSFDRPGLSAAINHGWAARGERYRYLAWLGDDDLLAPGSVAAAREALEGDPRATAVYGHCRVIWADGSTQYVARPGRFAAWWIQFGEDRVHQQGSLFRGEVVRRLGGLDESLRYAMDMDLFLRLRREGPLLYIPVELGAYRQHGSAISYNRSVGADEPSEARRRWRSATADAMADRFGTVVDVVDRAYGIALRRIPSGPPPAGPDGGSYTGVDESARTLWKSVRRLAGTGPLSVDVPR